jgi:hypothetical protein
MKKIFTLAVALAGCCAANAAEYNVFPGTDGWLMFNNQSVVDEYVGTINETAYTIETRDGKAKQIQMVYSDVYPDYPATEVDVDVVGAGTDGELEGTDALTGAIILAPASAVMSTNGGGFIVRMPSCSTYTIKYSCINSVYCRILATTNPAATLSASSADYALDSANGWKVISAKYATVFNKLPYGLNDFSGIESLSNGSDGVTIKSETPIYVWFQSLTARNIYIHGIKVTTTNENDAAAGVENVISDAVTGPKTVYTIDGKSVGTVDDMSTLGKGLYIVKQGGKATKIAIR